MKLSNRKQLLSEADAELKRMKRLNESLQRREVEKATQWLENAASITVEDENKNYFFTGAAGLSDYLKISTSSPKDAETLKKTTTYFASRSSQLITIFKEKLKKMKKLEASLPEIEKVVKTIESDLKRMK